MALIFHTMDEWSLDGIIFHSLEDAITLPSLVPEPNTEGDSGGGFVIDSTRPDGLTAAGPCH